VALSVAWEEGFVEHEFERETLHDLKLEMSLIGGALQGDAMSRWFSLNVPPTAFYRKFHQIVAGEIINLVKDGILPDYDAIRAKLEFKGMLDESTREMLEEI
jgi:replicative DNA helicase